MSVVTTKAGLWGKGDISITSIAGAGEDEGSGGVVITSSKVAMSVFEFMVIVRLSLTQAYHGHWPDQERLRRTKTVGALPIVG